MQRKLYELVINEELDNELEVSCVSGVDRPAIERGFLAFNESNTPMQFVEVNEDERILVGPAMIPNTPIRRIDEATGEEYDVFFSKDTIEKIAVKFFAKGFQNNFNLMHDPNLKMDGVVFFQSFIKDSNKGIEGMTGDYIDGTWFLGAKVYNDEVWAKVKSGEIKGWSVEGIFGYKAMPMPIEQQQYDAILKIISELN